MNGEVVPLPSRDGAASTGELAIPQYRIDTAPAEPMRSRSEILKEAVLLVPNLAKLLFRLLKDPRVPRTRRILMAGVGAYVVSPIDLIPDFVPVLGSVDDLLLLAFAVDYLLQAAPPGVVDDYWDGTEDALELVRGLAGWGTELIPGRIRRLLGG
jgi:uncharacterized membrane protein YkvA (DUF1232 family)